MIRPPSLPTGDYLLSITLALIVPLMQGDSHRVPDLEMEGLDLSLINLVN